MLQLTYTGPDALEWREAPAPQLSSDAAALVRPRAVATCDLDGLIIEGASPFAPPFALGHECVAEVIDVGDTVSSFAPGQLVSVPFQISCGECDACRQGRTANCSGVAFMSSYGFGPAVAQWGGFLSDVVCVPYAEHMLVPIPAGLAPAAVASASDNISDAWRAVAPALAEQPGADVLVVGGAGRGSIGLYAAGLAVALGSASVLYVDADEARRTDARTDAQARRPVRDHRRLERRPRRPRARAALDRARRRLHEHRDLLRRAAVAATARDVHQGHHVQDRPRERAPGDAARARARRLRRAASRAGDHARRRLVRRGRRAARARLDEARDRALRPSPPQLRRSPPRAPAAMSTLAPALPIWDRGRCALQLSADRSARVAAPKKLRAERVDDVDEHQVQRHRLRRRLPHAHRPAARVVAVVTADEHHRR
jgi:threonine dehydrogenase-like Zn-dependent dehydrogenase